MGKNGFYRNGCSRWMYFPFCSESNKDDIGWHWISTISMPHSQKKFNQADGWGFTILGIYIWVCIFSLNTSYQFFVHIGGILWEALSIMWSYNCHRLFCFMVSCLQAICMPYPLSPAVILGAATGWYVADCAGVLRRHIYLLTAEATN